MPVVIQRNNQIASVAVILSFSGDLTLREAPEVKHSFQVLRQENIPKIIVILSEIRKTSPNGLNVLTDALTYHKEKNFPDGLFLIVIDNPELMRIFEVTGLDQLFDIVKTTKEAFEKFGIPMKITPQEKEKSSPIKDAEITARPKLAIDERLMRFFKASPYTANTARQIAAGLGEKTEDILKELEKLKTKRFIQKICYRSGNVYQYIPKKQ